MRKEMQTKVANLPPAQHLARPGANPFLMVSNMMFMCGVNTPMIFQRDSQAKQITGEVFDCDFMSCMDNTVK